MLGRTNRGYQYLDRVAVAQQNSHDLMNELHSVGAGIIKAANEGAVRQAPALATKDGLGRIGTQGEIHADT